MEENISTFVAITGSSADVATGFLEMANGDFERAVALYYENPDLISGVGAAANQAQQASMGASRHNVGREDASGVIHIDSDDDDMNLDNDSDEDDANAAVAHAAALAQEEEDAAMAKRLQEELYSSGGGGGGGPAGEDDVRAPIARTTETLVAPDPTWGADDDMGSHILDQLRRQRQAAGACLGLPPRREHLCTDKIVKPHERVAHSDNGFGATHLVPNETQPKMERTHAASKIFSDHHTTS
jgi:hypothetical protein